MIYVSIDIETGGLIARDKNSKLIPQIIEFGAILDDLENPKPLEELPTFHCYFLWDHYTGDPYALQMHSKIFKRIAEEEEGYNYYYPHKFGYYFYDFLKQNGLEPTPSPENKKALEKVYINVAGKNFGTFDMVFLDEQTDLSKYVRMRHRFVDPGTMFMRKEDESVPSLEECLKRAKMDSNVKHDAVSDALDVVKLVRYKMT